MTGYALHMTTTTSTTKPTPATQIAIRLPAQLLQAIDSEAAKVGLTRASYIRMTLTQATKHTTTEGAAK